MTEIKRVKINDILDSQIPEFLNVESPLFQEFLKQYYISQEHQTGVVDLASNIQDYKKIQNFNNETLIDSQLPAQLVAPTLYFDDTIYATHTIGYPDQYGLLKIDNEIITYTSKGYTTLDSKTVGVFYGCVRGFSGIDNIQSDSYPQYLNFSSTQASEHFVGATVNNLNYQFFSLFFKKFKAQFIPGFEERNFVSGISIQNILTRAKDFYTSKGTDQSFKILFSVLFGKQIDVIKPQNYMLRPSDNNYFKTQNILVEKISGGDPLLLRGSTLYQALSGIGTVSASIYNIEYRPVEKKNLYEISLDSTSFFGNFQVTGFTKVTETINQNSNYITVDSTVGFANAGSVYVKTSSGNNILVTYTDKTNNQLLNVSGITTTLYSNNEVYENKLAYSYIGYGTTSLVTFRTINVIDSIDFSASSGLSKGDKISLNSFGEDLSKDPYFNSWIYNNPTYHNIQSIVQLSSNTYRITLYDNVDVYKNQIISISGSSDVDATITSVETGPEGNIKNQFVIKTNVSLDLSAISKIKRKVEKTSSPYFSNASSIIGGIHNTYISSDRSYLYVTSSGFPNYQFSSKDTKVQVTTGSATTTILNAPNHNFLTGEKIYYSPTSSTSGIATGTYFVTKITDNSISISYSNTDVFAGTYINANSNITDYVFRLGYENKDVKNQKLLKKINLKGNVDYFATKQDKTTFNKQVGILINGVEIYSPTLYDENIYYGKIDSINVTNKGSAYDVINYPSLSITDLSGNGCVAYPIVSGSLDSVRINSPGIGYDRKPKITLVGGNGSGAVLDSNLVKSQIRSSFNANLSGVDAANDVISFLSNHNFDNTEQIVYYANGNAPVAGLIDGSSYYAQVLNQTQIKLATNVGLSTFVNITGISSGTHEFRTLNSKNTITQVYVKNPGSGYSNRLVKISSVSYPSVDYQISGISTFDSYIFAKNHGFKNGDYVRYSYSDTPITGLSTSIEYQVTLIDKNKFKLSDSGIGTTSSSTNYINKKYVQFGSLGVGTHTFAYPPIKINIESVTGIGSTSIATPVLTPLVLGSIESVYIENGGSYYGTPNIINYHRRPNVGVTSIQSAILKPIIINGSINDVQIIYAGNGYDSGTKIKVYGNGEYADLQAIVNNGSISKVLIANGGVGYASSNTTLNTTRRGTDAQFLANVFEWKINQIERNKSLLSYYNDDDETITHPNSDVSLGLGVINLYVPRKIRKNTSDNIQDNNLEPTSNLAHSPLLGWAYDGNPIYGPYGYTSLTDKTVKQIKSSYNKKSLVSSDFRPNNFTNGFFIQDYQYNNNQDLDEYNGRFCITPEFPYGTYAYFATYDSTSNPFIPEYPYVVGNYFKSSPLNENFNPKFSQDKDLSKLKLTRNFGNYYLNSINSGYEILDKVNANLKQDYIVDITKKSGITSVFIDVGGNNYSVNDIINFEPIENGIGANANISRVKGKPIVSMNVGVSSYYNTTFFTDNGAIIGITSSPHNLLSGDNVIISGISTISLPQLQGTKSIYVYQKTTGLTTSLLTAAVTGVTTTISVSDVFGFNVDDTIQIGIETARIFNIIPETSTLVVNRDSAGGVHTVGIDNVRLLSNRFQVLNIDPINFSLPKNNTVYFDPNNTIGFGTVGNNYSVVGIGTSVSNNRFVPSKTIYIQNHNFYTGQPLVYNYSSGIGLSVYGDSAGGYHLSQNQLVYAVNLGNNYLGISTLGFTTSVGIGTTLNSLLFAYDASVGYAHSFTTLYPTVTSKVENYSGIVTTSQAHNLSNGDKIRLNLIPSRNESVKFRFDAKNRKITTDFIGFTTSFVSIGSTISTIYLQNNNLKTGDKVIYYAGNSPIGGLTDSSVYYVLKQDPDKIQLCNYFYDTTVGVSITFTSSGIGTQNIALVNPPLNFTQGNTLFFDTSDSSLTNFRLDFYLDSNFQNKFEIDKQISNSFVLNRSGVGITATTQSRNIPSVLYYNFSSTSPSDQFSQQLSIDTSVTGHNKIILNPSILSNNFSIIGIGSTSFKFNVLRKPEYSSYTYTSGISSIFYDTNSISANGPISEIKINTKGKSYLKTPAVVSISSTLGQGASLFTISSEIGKVLSFNRIKDGFDYPTDPTISAQLGIPAICVIKGISNVGSVGILTGGKNYNTAPKLKVIGNDLIKLSTSVQGGSVVNVNIDQNSSSLNTPLSIVPYNNSNGYPIDNIYPIDSNGTIRIELLNDPITYPSINIGYGSSVKIFPFSVGDQIFVEKCRLNVGTANSANFNSTSYGFNFFTVVGVNTTNYTVDYSMVGLQTGLFGTYTNALTRGYVVNQKDMAKFQMNLANTAKYYSGELVTSGSNFSATVMEDGWNSDTNQLKLINCQGTINPGDQLLGKNSQLKGNVKYISKFNVPTTFGITREKINNFGDNVGYLNDFQQRISDNDYYQKFSYSIKGEVPYNVWKEAVKSIVHPSGFKEFSDLSVIGIPTSGPINLGIGKSSSMKVSVASSEPSLLVNVDQTESLYTKHNFSMVYEDDQLDDGSVERIYFPQGVILKSYILNKTNKVSKIDDISSQFTGITTTLGGSVVGLSSFKLTSNGFPVFFQQFVGSSSTVVDLTNDKFFIPNHGFQSGQDIVYNYGSGTPIGIATTSLAQGTLDIIMQVGAGIGSAIYENGYNNSVPYSGIVTGISTTLVPAGPSIQYFGYGNPIPGITTSGIGTGATFQVAITYNTSTGVPIGTTIQLINGGSGYSIGQQVSIAGTFLKGSNPTNNLYFTISKLSTTRAGTPNTTYTSIGSTSTGIGSGAIFTVTRDSNSDVSSVTVVSGGSGYKFTDQVIISGSSVGGATPADNIYLSPTLLGTNKLPTKAVLLKKDVNSFQISGFSTTLSSPFDLISYGTGTQSFGFARPNENAMISIDNIIQSALHRKNINIGLASSVGLGTTTIYVSLGISSITTNDILQIDNEYFKINSIGIGSTNILNVTSAFMGSVSAAHTVGTSVTVVTGDFNIVNDTIYFSTPPYGPSVGSTDPEIRSNSSFAGRVFSRSYDSAYANDVNLILDDISTNFTGIAATQFTLNSNGNNVVGIYTNRNYSTNIDNNPVILINNVFQTPESDYTIDNSNGSNTIRFLTGIPNSGRISKVAITTGFGYQPLIGAAATVSVSAAGTINSITLKGAGSGYRNPPNISIASTIGYGATITATVGSGGTITSFVIVNGGIGYTNTSLPTINVEIPSGYSNLGIAYTAGSVGLGQSALVSVQVGSGSSITQFILNEPGVGYKVGDVLRVVGIATNPSVGVGFSEFRITVTEVFTDKFSGFYPGQFIKFDDFSQYFNGVKTKFTLSQTISGVTNIIDLKTNLGSDIILDNNIFVYLNDVLQVPGESYIFSGTRIIFNEPPKTGSKCSVLFYRGSSVDVEQVTPPDTIKIGDTVQIEKNSQVYTSTSEFERIVKQITTSDQLDTYNYDSVGIDTNVNNFRPLKWTKQTQDRIINGSLISKARPSLISTIRPATKLIKSVQPSDTTIYVNNSFPLFTSVDGIPQADANALIVNNKDTSNAIATAIVSSASTISSISIITGGTGYGATTSPKVALSTSQVLFKDPIYSWNNTIGINTTDNLLSVVNGSPIVSVGGNGYVAISTDGKAFSIGPNIGYVANFNSVGLGSTNVYISVSSTGKIMKAIGYGSTISNWSSLNKYTGISTFGFLTLYPNSSTNNLNEIKYSSSFDRWICVGTGGTIFTAIGYGATSFIMSPSGITQTLNSVAFGNNLAIAVGNNGYICVSSNGTSWTAYQISSYNLNKIIWTGTQYIIVGSNGTVLTSTENRLQSNGGDWTTLSTNISDTLSNIKYISSYQIYLTWSSTGTNFYYSFDLQNWTLRQTGQSNVINDSIFINNSLRTVIVGNASTAIYSDPVYNFATFSSSVSSGIVTSVTVVSPGFGYNPNNPPVVLIEPEPTVSEQITAIKADGDFGVIVGMDTSLSIGSTIPRISFNLKSESYNNNTLGIGYSSLDTFKNSNGSYVTYTGISTGDYFIIYNSNVQCGHALTGITTTNMQVVGTTTSFIDGVYRADSVGAPVSGIVTVTCTFLPGPGYTNKISFTTNPGIITNGYFGNYTWGKIFGYQNRSLGKPKQFNVDSSNGLIGLSTAPEVTRTRGLFKSK